MVSCRLLPVAEPALAAAGPTAVQPEHVHPTVLAKSVREMNAYMTWPSASPVGLVTVMPVVPATAAVLFVVLTIAMAMSPPPTRVQARESGLPLLNELD